MLAKDNLNRVKTKNKAVKSSLFFAIIFLTFVFIGCKKEVSNLNQTPVNANNSNQTSASNSKIKLFNGKGVVTKINLELGSVELDHEKIEGAMPAMIMEFYVKEKGEIEVLKVGDKVEFVLEENFGQEKIISIKKIQ